MEFCPSPPLYQQGAWGNLFAFITALGRLHLAPSFFFFFLSCSFARHQQITRLSRRQEIEREPTKCCSQRSLVAATGHVADTRRTLTKAFADFVIICQESVLLWGRSSEMSCCLILAKLKSIDPTEFSWAQCLPTGHWPPETQSQTAIWLFFFFLRSHPHKASEQLAPKQLRQSKRN